MEKTAIATLCKYYHQRLFKKYAGVKGYIGNYCPGCQETDCPHHIDNHHLPVSLLALSAGREVEEVADADY